MQAKPDFEFLTTKILNPLESRGPLVIDEIVRTLQRPQSSCSNTLTHLGALGCVSKQYISQYVYLYTFVGHMNKRGQRLDATPMFKRPDVDTRVMIRETMPRKRRKSESGTGIITPARQPQPFKPLVRRDFLERMELAEMTR